MSAYVYRVYDAADRLLYVGCTSNLELRLRSHELNSVWHPYMDRIETEIHPSRREAEDAEALAILTEHPRWNVQGRSPEHPEGQMPAGGLMRAGHLEYERTLYYRHRKLVQQEARLIAEVRRTRHQLRVARQEIEDVKHGRASDVDLSDIA